MGRVRQTQRKGGNLLEIPYNAKWKSFTFRRMCTFANW